MLGERQLDPPLGRCRTKILPPPVWGAPRPRALFLPLARLLAASLGHARSSFAMCIKHNASKTMIAMVLGPELLAVWYTRSGSWLRELAVCALEFTTSGCLFGRATGRSIAALVCVACASAFGEAWSPPRSALPWAFGRYDRPEWNIAVKGIRGGFATASDPDNAIDNHCSIRNSPRASIVTAVFEC